MDSHTWRKLGRLAFHGGRHRLEPRPQGFIRNAPLWFLKSRKLSSLEQQLSLPVWALTLAAKRDPSPAARDVGATSTLVTLWASVYPHVRHRLASVSSGGHEAAPPMVASTADIIHPLPGLQAGRPRSTCQQGWLPEASPVLQRLPSHCVLVWPSLCVSVS